MNPSHAFFAVLVLAFATAPSAQEANHRLSDHPAVVVKRNELKQTYDYQAKFYPHPAWLYLQAEAPRPMMDHPAVLIARRNAQAAAHESSQVTALSQRASAEASLH